MNGTTTRCANETTRRGARRRVGARLAALTLAAGTIMGSTLAFSGVAAAASSLQPYVTCYWPNADGTYTLDVGYTNTTSSTLTYPVGPQNYVTPNPKDRGQPTVFYPGTHDNVWAPTLTQADLSAGADWVVHGAHASASIRSIPQCASKPIPVSGGPGGVVVATAAALLVGSVGYRQRVRYRGLRDRLRFGRSS